MEGGEEEESAEEEEDFEVGLWWRRRQVDWQIPTILELDGEGGLRRVDPTSLPRVPYMPFRENDGESPLAL